MSLSDEINYQTGLGHFVFEYKIKEFIKRQIDRTQYRIEELKEFDGCAEAMLQKAELEVNLEQFKKEAGEKLTSNTPNKNHSQKEVLNKRGVSEAKDDAVVSPTSDTNTPNKNVFVDFNGKRFYPPFRCLCCGKEISEEQFCYGRTCGYCDCGKCKKSRGIGLETFKVIFEEGHGRKDIFDEAEDTPIKSGKTITDAKIVGLCSKCRKEGDEILKDINGRAYRDEELSCVGCSFKQAKEVEDGK